VKVYVFPADAFGCGYYRMIWPGRAANGVNGVEVEIIMPDDRSRHLQAIMHDDELLDVKVPNDADVIVMQRVTHSYLAQAVAKIRSKGIAVVVDMDDDLERIHPSNPAWQYFKPKSDRRDTLWEHSWHNARKACSDATLVTVTTPSLAVRYAPHQRVAVLPNCVPEWYLTVEHVDSERLGYGGSLHSHPDDVPRLGHSVATLVREGYDFMVVADPRGMQEVLNLPHPPISPGAVPIEDWPRELTKIGVGLVPLAPTQFNEAKSWLKGLEQAAVGVPFLASPRYAYRALHAHGAGRLVPDKPAAWLKAMRRLLEHPEIRAELSAAGRVAAARWTYEQRGEEWAAAWQQAYTTERRSRSALLRSS